MFWLFPAVLFGLVWITLILLLRKRRPSNTNILSSRSAFNGQNHKIIEISTSYPYLSITITINRSFTASTNSLLSNINQYRNLYSTSSNLRPTRWISYLFMPSHFIFAVVMVCGLGVVLWNLGVSFLRSSEHIEYTDERSKIEWFRKELKSGAISVGMRNPSSSSITEALTWSWLDSISFLMSISIVAMVHELGHAVCAISQHVSVLSFGLTMYLMIPAFFVNIDDDALSLSPRVAQLQVIAAGVWMNLVLCGFLYLSDFFKPWQIGYGNGDAGVMVVDVLKNSPFYSQLTPFKSVIPQIDDIIIRDSSSFISALLLSHSDSSSTESGTCISNPQSFSQADTSCCHINVTHPFPSESSLSCFITSDSSITSQSDNISPQSICLNYADVVKNKRCNTSKECEPLDSSKNEWKNKCYKPYLPNPNVKLMRLYVGDVNTIYENREQRDQHDGNQAVIWWGTSSGIMEYVRIGDIIPRYWYYPAGFPYLTQSFLRQTNQISFSLAVINSLPIYNLDGNYFLCTILSWPWFWTIIPKVVTNWGYTRRKEIEKWIVRGTTFLIGIAIIRSTLSS